VLAIGRPYVRSRCADASLTVDGHPGLRKEKAQPGFVTTLGPTPA
jgi:hypothetical protein